MKWRFRPARPAIVVPLLAVCQPATAPAEPTAQTVTVRSEAPSVRVELREPGRQFLELPALEYSFAVEARCMKDWVPELLSLNVADSRVAFGARQLADNEHRRFALQIPARQLAPIAMHDFCQAEENALPSQPSSDTDDLDDAPMTVAAILSAQLSLLCRNGDEQNVTYLSQPLDLTLTCEPPARREAAD